MLRTLIFGPHRFSERHLPTYETTYRPSSQLDTLLLAPVVFVRATLAAAKRHYRLP